jgi:hypothetical protein
MSVNTIFLEKNSARINVVQEKSNVRRMFSLGLQLRQNAGEEMLLQFGQEVLRRIGLAL